MLDWTCVSVHFLDVRNLRDTRERSFDLRNLRDTSERSFDLRNLRDTSERSFDLRNLRDAQRYAPSTFETFEILANAPSTFETVEIPVNAPSTFETFETPSDTLLRVLQFLRFLRLKLPERRQICAGVDGAGAVFGPWRGLSSFANGFSRSLGLSARMPSKYE